MTTTLLEITVVVRGYLPWIGDIFVLTAYSMRHHLSCRSLKMALWTGIGGGTIIQHLSEGDVGALPSLF